MAHSKIEYKNQVGAFLKVLLSYKIICLAIFLDEI